MTKKIINACSVLLCALATASQAQSATPGSQPAAEYFQTVSRRASNLIRINQETDWSSYRAYRLAPAVYEPAGKPSGAARELRPEEAGKIKAVVDRSLQKRFQRLPTGEDAVLEVRPVITGFKRTSTVLNVIGFAAIQAPVSFGGASVRYELFDGRTGEEVGEISCKSSARPWNVYPWNALYNFQALGQGSVILKSDSARLRKDLERLGRPAVTPGQDAPRSAE
jgi:hypothetical protein